MKYMYGIFAVVGWIWTVVLATFLILRQLKRSQQSQQHEKHS